MPRKLTKKTALKKLAIISTKKFSNIIPALSKVSNIGFLKAKIIPTKQ